MTLKTTYLGLRLEHPFMVGASPLTLHFDNARRLEDGGSAAIVMHSLFEEQIAGANAGRFPGVDRPLARRGRERGDADPPGEYPDQYLEQLRRVKAAVSIPVIGSLNGVGHGDWLSHARLIEQAGADAIELNAYFLSTGMGDISAAIETQIERLVKTAKSLVRIPVAVKLSPFYTTFVSLAARLAAAGADGLVLFNRLYQPDVDIETLETLPNVRLSTSSELLLRLHGLAMLSGRVEVSLAATGGVHTVVDGVKALLCGADAVQMVSAIIQQGPVHIREMEQGLRAWMATHHYESIDAFRGRMSFGRDSDPAAFERGAYMRMLQSENAV